MSLTTKIRLGVWGVAIVAMAVLYSWKMSQKARDRDLAQRSNSPTERFEPRPLHLDRYTLTERSGRPFPLSELQGKVWIASFFFSSCNGPCRIMNHRVAELQKELAGTPVLLVSISVDPERDTPERLREYADGLNADQERWLFLTAPAEVVQRLAREEFLLSGGGTANAETGHADITHSDRLIPVDREGRMHYPVSVTSDAEVLAMQRRVRKMLADK